MTYWNNFLKAPVDYRGMVYMHVWKNGLFSKCYSQWMYIYIYRHEDPLEKEVATHSNILAWRIPWTRAWWAIVHRVTKSWTWLSDSPTWKNWLFPKCYSQWVYRYMHTFYVLFSHYLRTSFLFSGNLLGCHVCHLICNSDLSPGGRRVLRMKPSSGLRGRPDTKSYHVPICLSLFSSLLIRMSQKWGLLILVIGFPHGEAPPKYPGNLPCFW